MHKRIFNPAENLHINSNFPYFWRLATNDFEYMKDLILHQTFTATYGLVLEDPLSHQRSDCQQVRLISADCVISDIAMN